MEQIKMLKSKHILHKVNFLYLANLRFHQEQIFNRYVIINQIYKLKMEYRHVNTYIKFDSLEFDAFGHGFIRTIKRRVAFRGRSG